MLFEIRPYRPSDKTKVLALLDANIPAFFAPGERADFVEYLEEEIEEYFVVEENGALIGAGGINYVPDEGEAHLSWDMIKPSEQGRKIGKALTEYRLQLLSQHPDVDTIVVRTSQLVYPFYAKMGFLLKSVRVDFWAEGFDLYVMKRSNEVWAGDFGLGSGLDGG